MSLRLKVFASLLDTFFDGRDQLERVMLMPARRVVRQEGLEVLQDSSITLNWDRIARTQSGAELLGCLRHRI